MVSIKVHTVEPVGLTDEQKEMVSKIDNLVGYAYAKAFWGFKNGEVDLRLIEAKRLVDNLLDSIYKRDKYKVEGVF